MAEIITTRVHNKASPVPEVHVLWITAGLGCDGDTISVTAATQPSIEDLLMGAIPGLPKVHLHNPVLAYENGDEFMKFWYDAEAGKLDPFILVVEGSIPDENNKTEGYWAALGTDRATGQPITTCEWIDRLAPKAWAVLCAGTCSAYGGIHAMAGNPTGCMGLADYLGWSWKSRGGLPIVNVPGCPVQPDNFTETLLYLLYQAAGRAPMIPLDENLRPNWLFGQTVHEGCDRAGFYEQGDFADAYGEVQCIVKLGCWGPVVQCNVGKRGWMAGIGGCPNVGGICIGCTMPGFPDKFMPFMNEPPGAKLSSTAILVYGRTIRALRNFTKASVNKEPSWRSNRAALASSADRSEPAYAPAVSTPGAMLEEIVDADAANQRAMALLEKMARLGRSENPASHLFPGLTSGAAAAFRAAGPWQAGLTSEQLRYRAVVEQIPAVTFMAALDESVHELYISPQIEAMLGFSQEQWLADPFLWYWQLHTDDRLAWANEFARTCSTGVNFRSEYRIIARDGRIVWVHGECQLIKDDQGHPLFLLGIAFDITERKLAEQRLQESNRAMEKAIGAERQAHAALLQAQNSLTEINQTLERRVVQRTAELETAHAQLIQTARQAGMAEVASNVLHNVGNVLNSVNVRATLVQDKVKKSRLDGFARICQLMEEHSQNLGQFISADDQGRHLPEYIKMLTGHLMAERAGIMEDLDALNSYIGHIKQLISSQQSYAKGGTFYEPADVASLVNEACDINAAHLARHLVTVERDIPDLPRLRLDRHKTLQILVNLIGNAARACDGVDRADRSVKITVRRPRPETIEFHIADNGIGIAPESLARIFAHGFTTRPDGHGFGLHSSANAAREMHGSLVAASEGMGRGAVFTLTLPCVDSEVRESPSRSGQGK